MDTVTEREMALAMAKVSLVEKNEYSLFLLRWEELVFYIAI
jgi:hypothetical protein